MKVNSTAALGRARTRSAYELSGIGTEFFALFWDTAARMYGGLPR